MQVLIWCLCSGARSSAESYAIPFKLSQRGEVSAAVYDPQGKMLRELARGMKFEAGEHQLSWDGLDRYGQPAPAGEYEWRLLRTPGFTREFLVNVGTNPSWSAFDLWPGNHAGPTSLMVDADTNLYIGSISSEGPPHLLKMSGDGRRKFWDSGTWGLRDGLIGMARMGEVLYLFFANGTLEIRRADTGAGFWGHPKLRKFPEQTLPFADLIHPNDPRAQIKPESRNQVSEMAFGGGPAFLVVTYRAQNEVRLFWPKDDLMVRTNIIPVADPKGCCVAPDGRIFVISRNAVVRVDPERGRVEPLVADADVVSPTRIAYDALNDDLLVAEHGENRDRVVRCRAADGKRVASYGRPGGRVYGVFNALDWGGLADIAADGKGGFFTVEEFPRRVAQFHVGTEISSGPTETNVNHVSRVTHQASPITHLSPKPHLPSSISHLQLVAQWFGGMQWGALCALDPADPTVVYLFPDHKHCARGRIDHAGRSWTLMHLYGLPEGFSWYVGQEAHRNAFPSFGGQSYWEVRHAAGQTFLVNNGRLQGGAAAVVRVDEEKNEVVPVAILGGLHPTLDRNTPPDWWLAAMKRAKYDPKTTGYEHFCFSWSDINRNGKIDGEEVRLGSAGNTFSEAHCFVDANWNVYYASRSPRFKASPPPAWLVITNEGTAELPVWNWDHARPGGGACSAREAAFGAASPFGIFRDSQGNTYTVCNAEPDWNKPDFPPEAWPNNTTRASRFHRWNPSGVLEWSVGLHTAAKDRPPGQFAQVRGILGEVRDCLVVVDAIEPASVWTRDGLFAGSLYGARANDGLPD